MVNSRPLGVPPCQSLCDVRVVSVPPHCQQLICTIGSGACNDRNVAFTLTALSICFASPYVVTCLLIYTYNNKTINTHSSSCSPLCHARTVSRTEVAWVPVEVVEVNWLHFWVCWACVWDLKDVLLSNTDNGNVLHWQWHWQWLTMAFNSYSSASTILETVNVIPRTLLIDHCWRLRSCGWPRRPLRSVCGFFHTNRWIRETSTPQPSLTGLPS